MQDFSEHRATDEECVRELDALFPNGPAGADVLAELARDGWAKSPLRAVAHPSVEQIYEESVRIHENLERLRGLSGRSPSEPSSPPPTMDEIRARHLESPDDPAAECADLVCRCLWDVFSDNHEVFTRDGTLLDLGSFRGSAGFLADWLNTRGGRDRYDYMDFYMGTIWVDARADLTPVYAMIFRRLRARGHDWVYHFPRLGIVDLRPLADALDQAKQDPADYDPSAAFEQEQERQEHDRQIREMRDQLDEDYRRAAHGAAAGPEPPRVAAYRQVYGRLPKGWPPTGEEDL